MNELKKLHISEVIKREYDSIEILNKRRKEIEELIRNHVKTVEFFEERLNRLNNDTRTN